MDERVVKLLRLYLREYCSIFHPHVHPPMIEPSQPTKSLIEEIDALSGNTLAYKEALALLVEIAYMHTQVATLDNISFQGKFVHKAYRILQRTGNKDENSQRLAQEFQLSIEKIRQMIAELLSFAPPDIQREFQQQFLDLTSEAFDRLLAFCNDLSWYKNYTLDTRRRSG